jgi:hypothetical protein
MGLTPGYNYHMGTASYYVTSRFFFQDLTGREVLLHGLPLMQTHQLQFKMNFQSMEIGLWVPQLPQVVLHINIGIELVLYR